MFGFNAKYTFGTSLTKYWDHGDFQPLQLHSNTRLFYVYTTCSIKQTIMIVESMEDVSSNPLHGGDAQQQHTINDDSEPAIRAGLSSSNLNIGSRCQSSSESVYNFIFELNFSHYLAGTSLLVLCSWTCCRSSSPRQSHMLCP